MRHFEPLAAPDKHHAVVADEVAAAHRGEADGVVLAFAGDSFAAINCGLLEVAAQRLRHDFTHAQRRPGWRVHFMPVVGLEDFDVVALGERFRRDVEEPEHHIDADAEVRRHDDRDATRGVHDLLPLRVGEAGGADHQLHALLAARGDMGERAFRTRKIDEHVAVAQCGCDVIDNLHSTRDAYELACVLSNVRVPCLFESGTELHVEAAQHGLNQRPPHAARRARNRDLQFTGTHIRNPKPDPATDTQIRTATRG